MKFNPPGAILQAARVTFRATNLNHRPMESIMSNPRIILRTIAAAAVGTAVVVSTAQAANTKASFRDVLQPNGQTRSTAEKFADGAACGMSPGHHIRVIMPVFEQCMAGKGWAFDHYQPDPSSRPRSGTTVNFTDTRGDANSRPRGNAALQADTRACKAGHLDVKINDIQMQQLQADPGIGLAHTGIHQLPNGLGHINSANGCLTQDRLDPLFPGLLIENRE